MYTSLGASSSCTMQEGTKSPREWRESKILLRHLKNFLFIYFWLRWVFDAARTSF